ncbi:hypothetical protein Nepgr_011551 [Nepenthes gracilis]|uniref:Uncharacterized protein n=1 Tax=Nepenthes gracilis TaxID=150966 RepID=A0AAD3SE98_NEPGR|nr:hypothetical protein Nepgr_011551 [Nepenthes gracilis]
MLCLNGQEIVFSGSINDLRSSSHLVKRGESSILNGDAEENLRRLIYEVASRSSKLTLSVNRRSHEVISIGLTKESVTSLGENQIGTLISPPPFSSTATTAYEKYNPFDTQRAEYKPTPCHKENDANISSCVELHCVPVADGSKMVQSALENIATSQGADDQVATGMDNLCSHMGSLALTKTEWNIGNQAAPPNIANNEPKHQNLRIQEMDGGMKTDGVSSFAIRRSALQDQLQHLRNFLEGEVRHPMTQSSFVGSSCATATFVHATSVPALLLPEIFASSIRAKVVAEFHPVPLLINLEDKHLDRFTSSPSSADLPFRLQ